MKHLDLGLYRIKMKGEDRRKIKHNCHAICQEYVVLPTQNVVALSR